MITIMFRHMFSEIPDRLIEMPCVPRVGERIIFKGTGTIFEVSQVTHLPENEDYKVYVLVK